MRLLNRLTPLLVVLGLCALPIVTSAPLVAQATLPTPSYWLSAPNLQVDKNSKLRQGNVTIGNLNPDDDTITVILTRSDKTKAGEKPYVLKGNGGNISFNLRDIVTFRPGETFFDGRLDVTAKSRKYALVGWLERFNNKLNRYEYQALSPQQTSCATPCESFVAPFKLGGPFTETVYSGSHNAGFFETPTLYWWTRDPGAVSCGSNNILDVPMSFHVDAGTLGLSCPFGLMFFDLPSWGDLWVMHAGQWKYKNIDVPVSGEAGAICIPACNPCDPHNLCYNPSDPRCSGCIKPTAPRITAGNNACVVGQPCSVTFSVDNGVVLTVTTPPGMTVSGNNPATASGTPTAEGKIRASGGNSCGSTVTEVPVTSGSQPDKSVNIVKTMASKECAPSGGTATAVFTIVVTNTSPVSAGGITVNVTDQITPSCNKSNIVLGPAPSSITYTCEGEFGAGQRTNTAIASIVGYSNTSTSTSNFVISECSDVCEGVGTPLFSFTKNESTNTAVTTANLTFPSGFTGVVAVSPTPVSGFSSGSVVSGASNNSTYNRPEFGQQPFAVGAAWSVNKNGQQCKSGSASVSISPKSQTCEQQNPFSIDDPTIDDPNGVAKATAIVRNGTGTIVLLAASDLAECNGNDPDYVKAWDTDNPSCGHSDTLQVQYSLNHPSEYWWAIVYPGEYVPGRTIGTKRTGCMRNVFNSSSSSPDTESGPEEQDPEAEKFSLPWLDLLSPETIELMYRDLYQDRDQGIWSGPFEVEDQ